MGQFLGQTGLKNALKMDAINVGAGLPAMAGDSVHLIHRVACIAGKPGSHI
jgi:hypothetical protein